MRKSDRSRRELYNEYLVAKVDVDTAENALLKVRFVFELFSRMFVFTEAYKFNQIDGGPDAGRRGLLRARARERGDQRTFPPPPSPRQTTFSTLPKPNDEIH